MSTQSLVLSRLSDEPQTAYEIAAQIRFSHETVRLILRRALANGRVVREAISNGSPRWVYGWRLICERCGR
jgi:predicted transcriptional regulator